MGTLHLPQMSPEMWVMQTPWIVQSLLMMLVGIAGIVGAVQAGLTREDAFTAADRMPKWAWVAILLVSAVACLSSVGFLGLVGCIFIGLYFFDVRPHIRNLLSGNYGW